MPITWYENKLVNALAITDTALHIPTLTSTNIIVDDIHYFYQAEIKVESTLDQIVAVQVYSGIGRKGQTITQSALTNYDSLGASFFVVAGNVTTASQTRVMSYGTATIPDLIFVGLTASVSPTVGTVTVTMICSGIRPGFN